MIDAQGLRLNVGIILSNGNGQVLWARRAGRDAWQFPQGGMRRHDTGGGDVPRAPGRGRS